MTDVVSKVVSQTPAVAIHAAQEAGWILVGTFIGYAIARFMPELPVIGKNRGVAVAVVGSVLAVVVPNGLVKKIGMGAAVGGALEAMTPLFGQLASKVGVMRE